MEWEDWLSTFDHLLDGDEGYIGQIATMYGESMGLDLEYPVNGAWWTTDERERVTIVVGEANEKSSGYRSWRLGMEHALHMTLACLGLVPQDRYMLLIVPAVNERDYSMIRQMSKATGIPVLYDQTGHLDEAEISTDLLSYDHEDGFTYHGRLRDDLVESYRYSLLLDELMDLDEWGRSHWSLLDPETFREMNSLYDSRDKKRMLGLCGMPVPSTRSNEVAKEMPCKGLHVEIGQWRFLRFGTDDFENHWPHVSTILQPAEPNSMVLRLRAERIVWERIQRLIGFLPCDAGQSDKQIQAMRRLLNIERMVHLVECGVPVEEVVVA